MNKESEVILQEALHKICLDEHEFDLYTITEPDYIDDNEYCEVVEKIEEYLEFIIKKHGVKK